MKKISISWRTITVAALVAWNSVTFSLAEVPRIISFQGRAVNANGGPLNGSFNLTFRLYEFPTNGLALWTETQTNVVVSQGVFSVSLGSVTPLSPPFDRQYWLGIQVNTNIELKPRQALASAPYALRAAVADSLSSNATVTIALPTGMVVMWYGPSTNVPPGWILCDGANNTPDLRGRFAMGQDGNSSIGTVGGSVNHLHSGTTGALTGDPTRIDDNSGGSDYDWVNPTGHQHTFTTSQASNLPPFVVLNFIMKL